MKWIVFGGSRGAGRRVVERALKAGHEVTAFARSKGDLDLSQSGLSFIAGDVRDLDQVTMAVAGHDAVICAIGNGTDNSPQSLRTEAMENIRAAMSAQGVERLVCLSALGVGESEKGAGLVFRWIIKPLFTGNVVADQTGMEQVVRSSDLKWTLVRPPALTDKPARGSFRTSTDPEFFGMQISREDLAELMVQSVCDEATVGQAISVAW